MSTLQKFKDTMREVKTIPEVLAMIKTDEVLNNAILDVSKKVIELKEEELNETQVKYLDNLVVKINELKENHLNNVLKQKQNSEILLNFQKMLQEIKSGDFDISLIDEEHQDFVKQALGY